MHGRLAAAIAGLATALALVVAPSVPAGAAIRGPAPQLNVTAVVYRAHPFLPTFRIVMQARAENRMIRAIDGAAMAYPAYQAAQAAAAARAAATVQPAAGSGSGPAPRPAPAPVTGSGFGIWDCIAAHESGNGTIGSADWSIDTGNGYYGGLQFDYGTWLAYGGGAYAQTANLASPGDQVKIAERVQSGGWNGHAPEGWGAWPVTSGECGV